MVAIMIRKISERAHRPPRVRYPRLRPHDRVSPESRSRSKCSGQPEVSADPLRLPGDPFQAFIKAEISGHPYCTATLNLIKYLQSQMFGANNFVRYTGF